MDADFPSSNQFIRRPPPLDPRVEQELRNACEIVLRDLKPSGHDIEDRRMKTDILVNIDPYKLEHQVRNAAQNDTSKPKRQHSAAAWIMSGETEQQENPSTSSRDVRGPEATVQREDVTQARNTKGDINAPRTNESPQSNNHTQLLVAEGPLAPMPSNTTGTRQPSVVPSSHQISSPLPAQRPDSTSTDASAPFTPSTEHYKSTSTAPSSAAMTSADSSNRASESIYTQAPTAQDEQWMKQEVEKHRQSQGPVPTAPGAAQATGTGVSAETGKAMALKDRRGSQDAQTLNLNSKLGIDTTKRPTITTRSSSRQSASFSAAPAASTSPPITSPILARQGSSGSTGAKRQSRSSNRLSIDGVPETRLSPQHSPRNEDVPPVPRLDAERLSSLTNASRSNSINQNNLADMQRHRVEGNRTNDSQSKVITSPRPAATATSSTQNSGGVSRTMDSQDRAANAAKLQQAQQHSENQPVANNSHLQDRSVLVRDFPHQNRLGSNFRPNARDPTPADFDALMWAMDGAVRAPVGQQPASLFVTDSSASSRPTLLGPKDIVSRSSSNYSSRSEKADKTKQQAPNMVRGPTHMNNMTTQQAIQPSTQHIQITRPQSTSMVNEITASKPATSQKFISRSRPTSVVPPARTSGTYSNRSAGVPVRREKKGLSRLVWKLGGNDSPQTQNSYGSPPESQHIPIEGDDDWDEEEACAAPVVGFGRGW